MAMTSSGDAPPSRPLEERLPPPVFASPSDIRLESDQEPTWWQPGWDDVKAHVGWRWVLLAPAGLCVLLIVGGWFYPAFAGVAMALGVKLTLVVLAFSVSLVGYVTRAALNASKEPFCIYCGYNLTGLPDDYRCPECGRPYTHRLIEEYRKDPHWFIERWKQSRQGYPKAMVFQSGPTPRRNRASDGTE